ncbi:MAG: universal stress protein [Acidobacteriia bacterium]|nr:universal stress protein [Terriglobia bacterium]
MLASILLPLAEWPQAASARDYAFWLARRGGGHIQGLAVIDVKSFEIPVLGSADGFMPSVVSPPIAESQALLDELTRLAKERLDLFARVCEEKGISCSTDVRAGIPGEVIAREAVAHDLVVMSHAGYTRASKGDESAVDPLVSSVIRGSIRPVLVAGKESPAGGAVKSMMVAYDGSVHAARALSVVVELGSGPGIECLLTTVAPTEEAGQETLGPAEAFLYHHGVTPQKKVVIGTRASELLCDIVRAARSDILIMGAYGHSPIREMFFGCTTERILSHCEATVILQS